MPLCVCVCALLCLTFCHPVNCSPPGSSVYAIFQAKVLEWVAASYPRGSSDPGIGPLTLASPALAGRFFAIEPPGSPINTYSIALKGNTCENSSWPEVDRHVISGLGPL